jgi:endogenous inhibitor of DNA gyrase (YacG/DUF329 family)
MICSKCGAENAEQAQYCSLCFEPLREDEPSERIPLPEGVMVKCPSCGSVGPLEVGFCGQCAFAFEDVDMGEWVVEGRATAALRPDAKPAGAELMRISAGDDGAQVLRLLENGLSGGRRPRVIMAGRDDITFGMKLLARMGQDLDKAGQVLWLRPLLQEDAAVLHLDDLELVLELIISEKKQ